MSKIEPHSAAPLPPAPSAVGPLLEGSKVQALGLDPARIQIHAERLNRALKGTVTTTLPVLGACTVNNGGVLPWKQAVRFAEGTETGKGRAFLDSAHDYWTRKYLVTCIPAAGAASRYLAPLRKFVLQVEAALCAPSRDHAPGAAGGLHRPAEDLPGEEAQNMGLPSRSAHERVLLRRRLMFLEVPSELSPLTQLSETLRTDAPEMATQISELVKNIALHLTSDHSLAAGLIGRSPSEAPKVQAPPAAGTAVEGQPRTTNEALRESLIRRHWRPASARRAPSEPLGQPHRMLRILRNADFEGRHTTDWRTADRSTAGLDLSGSEGFLSSNELKLLEVYATARVLLDHFEAIPKALVPTTRETDDFLFLKLAEQMSLIPSRGNILICPANMKSMFENQIHDRGLRLGQEVNNIFDLARTPFAPHWLNPQAETTEAPLPGQWRVLEQGNSLSTLRFRTDGRPYELRSGSYSRVSGGHGELVHLFAEILEDFPQAECLHIRNIDNIIGTGPERRKEIQVPARLFRLVRDSLETLRFAFEGLTPQNLNDAQHEGRRLEALGAAALLARLSPLSTLSNVSAWEPLSLEELPAALARALSPLFHWQNFPYEGPLDEQLTILKEWLKRPLSIFGVVRKETGDVGGGPVYSKLPDGQSIKLCMEMPHASDEDREAYFGSRGKVTHFNPVLVFFELQTHKPTDSQPCDTKSKIPGRSVPFDTLFDDRFWLLAAKEFEGNKVCYHETVLYELIGNSARTNLIFVEVPRTLFNPHKSFMEGLGQDRKSYGFDETLKTQDERGFGP